jgi:hypothetical protein
MVILRQRPWLLALFIGVLLAGAAGLVSAHGGDSSLIHGCVSTSSNPRGQVTIYSLPGQSGPSNGLAGPTGSCGALGQLVDWNAQGIAGPSGPSGPQGPQGSLGPSGPSGPQGLLGASGPSGPAGASGPTGLGASGPSGPSGVLSPGVYGMVYSSITPLNVASNASVHFNVFGPAVGVTTTDTGFTIESDGVYRVRATCGTANDSTTLYISRGAVGQPAGAFLSGVNPVPCGTGEVVMQLSVGDVVRLGNPGGPAGLQLQAAGAGGASASMDIVKLS